VSKRPTMNEHDKFRELLLLSAAGALDTAEEALLIAHLSDCSDCTADLERLQQLAANLRGIPTPRAPGALVSRTILLAQNRLAEESARRTERRIMALVLVLSWAFVAVSWPIAQLIAHGWLSVFGFGFAQAWKSFAVFTGFCWIAGAAGAILLAARRSRERRMA
jgi:anti-sigma factor RsiW